MRAKTQRHRGAVPKGLPRGAVVPGFPGSPGGKNKNIWITFWRNGTGVNRRAALIRRLDDSPLRRFAGIAGALDNDKIRACDEAGKDPAARLGGG